MRKKEAERVRYISTCMTGGKGEGGDKKKAYKTDTVNAKYLLEYGFTRFHL